MNWLARNPTLCTVDGCDAKVETERLKAQVVLLRGALQRIERWGGEFPTTNYFWDSPKDTRPMSYGACYGSTGERDYMRQVAKEALEATKQLTKENQK